MVSADSLPNDAYWPDLMEVRAPAGKIGWPVLEVPSTIMECSGQRFGFQVAIEQLTAAFDAWYEFVRNRPSAICVFLNHQKREIFDADRRDKPWTPAGKNILQNMGRFFEYVQNRYIANGLPVKFSTAREATDDFIRNVPPPAVPEELNVMGSDYA